MPNRNRLSGKTLLIFMLSTALVLSGCIKSEEPLQKLSVTNINESPIGQKSEAEIGIDSNVFDANVGIDPYFDESAGILMKKWNASNFRGFWRDPKTGVSTEELDLDQSINNSNRVIEKHNLVYRTRPESVNFQLYRNTAKVPPGTKGSYQVMGWLGEKHVFFQGNKIAKIIFEQNATEKKIMTTGDSWYFEEGYRFFAHTVEAPLERMAWVEFLKDNKSLQELVIPDREVYAYQDTTGTPVFVTYPYIHRGTETDIGEFMYTWLRSGNLKPINFNDTFGIMEVTFLNDSIIELRNKEPIDLAPGRIIRLMGNITFEVSNSTTYLQFYPNSSWRYGTVPSVIETILTEHPILKTEPGIKEIAGDYYFRDYRQEGSKYNISAFPKRGGPEESIVITLQNDFTGKERLKNIEIIPENEETIASEIVSTGNRSGYKTQAFMVINSSQEWNKVWQKHVNYLTGEKPFSPEIDFTRETIIAVFLGETPAYDARLIDITHKAGNIFFNIQRTYPASFSSAQSYFIYRFSKVRDNAVFRTLKWDYTMPPGPALAAAYSAAELKDKTQIMIKYRPPNLNDSDIDIIFSEIAPMIKTVDGKKYDNVTANLMLEGAGQVSQDVWNFYFIFVLEGIDDNKAEWWRMKIYFTSGEKVSIPYPEGPIPGRIFG